MNKLFFVFLSVSFTSLLAAPQARLSFGVKAQATRSSVSVRTALSQKYNAGYCVSAGSNSQRMFRNEFPVNNGDRLGVLCQGAQVLPDDFVSSRYRFFFDGVMPSSCWERNAGALQEVAANVDVMRNVVFSDPDRASFVPVQSVEVKSKEQTNNAAWWRFGCDLYMKASLDFSQFQVGVIAACGLPLCDSAETLRDVHYSVQDFGVSRSTVSTSAGSQSLNFDYVTHAYMPFGGKLVTIPALKVSLRDREKLFLNASWTAGPCEISVFGGLKRVVLKVDWGDDFRVSYPYAWGSYVTSAYVQAGMNIFSVNPDQNMVFSQKMWGSVAGLDVKIPVKHGWFLSCGFEFSYVAEKKLEGKSDNLTSINNPAGAMDFSSLRSSDNVSGWHMSRARSLALSSSVFAKAVDCSWNVALSCSF